MRSRAAAQRSSLIWFCGRILLACTMAAVNPRAWGLGEKRGVEHDARRGGDAEADVAHAQNGLAARQRLRDGGDGVQGFARQRTVGVVASSDGERQAVEEDVLFEHAVLAGEQTMQAAGDGELALGGLGHGLFRVFVDGERDDRTAVLAQHACDACEPLLAGLEADGVDDALSAGELETGLDDVGLGAVEHEWGR